MDERHERFLPGEGEVNVNSNEFSTTDDDDDARWIGRDDIARGDRVSRRVSAFMASKPRAYANEVRLRRDDATRAPSGATRREREGAGRRRVEER